MESSLDADRRLQDADMIELPYSLVIEATEDSEFFAFFSEELAGFSGSGHSVEDCLYQAKWGMKEHVAILREKGLPAPQENRNPQITVRNAKKMAVT
jgi:predicted RNase H-like HicB family nuclease